MYGLDLKRWITNTEVLQVIDAVLLGNGFAKENSFANVKYAKDSVTIKSGHIHGWTINDTVVSFMHELQNEYERITGERLSVGAKVF